MPRWVACAWLLLAGCSSPDAPPGGSDALDSGASQPEGASGCGLFCLDDDAQTDAPSFVQVRGLVDQICSNSDGCHGQGTGHMALSPGNEFSAMIGVTSWEMPPLLRVKPFDPLESYVYLKLWCDGGIAPGTACMPGSHPDPGIAQRFHDWIEAGAPTQ